MGLACLEIDGREISLDQTDASLIAEQLSGQELGGRLVAAIMGPGETVVHIDADPHERQRLEQAVIDVASDDRVQFPSVLVDVLDALRR
jgi:hypothetical protein